MNDTPTPEEVYKLRKAHGLNQTEFGRLSYSTVSAVSTWEKGTRTMPPIIWEFYRVYFNKAEPRRIQ